MTKYVCTRCRRPIGHLEPEIPTPMSISSSPMCRYDFRPFVCIEGYLYCLDCCDYNEEKDEYTAARSV